MGKGATMSRSTTLRPIQWLRGGVSVIPIDDADPRRFRPAPSWSIRISQKAKAGG
jgi:hypothetical protein